MLELKKIVKDYTTGGSKVRALDGVSIQFRESEFVSILGPSGCGKTTLLNIIGGLDQYTSGDLVINGVSTKRYNDADWDTYRNHSIGFVFQNYNLIPHQSVLANVELALTLSGISKRERRARAVRALRDVGLGSQINKKPNQLSGGQMQRVAIARALVNDPDILLADEPTGALDTQTSVQIMDILRKISQKKLIIMVTHNPELAEEYSTRIIRVLDGKVTEDTNPYFSHLDPVATSKRAAKKPRGLGFFSVNERDVEALQLGGSGVTPARKTAKKKSMSFFTALGLSFNNLLTKKGRTFMTSLAGSIGIIGIALILSVSTGVNAYIDSVQRETLSSYPIELHAQSMDLGAVMTTLMDEERKEENDHELDKIYESIILAQLVNAMGESGTTTNDLVSFKEHLENNEDFQKYLSAIQYTYDFNWSVFVREGMAASENNEDAPVIKSDMMGWLPGGLGGMMGGSTGAIGGAMGSMMSSSTLSVWQEMLAPLDKDGDALINGVLEEQYEFVDEGSRWPTAPNEVVLVVNNKNEISDLSLYALGLRSKAEMMEGWNAALNGTQVDISERKSWTFEEIRSMEYRLILASECYEYDKATGTYTDLSATAEGRESLYENEDVGFTLKVVGIVRPREGVTATSMQPGTIGYTSALAGEALDRTLDSELLALQKENKDTDLLTGKLFNTGKEVTPEQKKSVLLSYIATLPEADAQKFLLNVLVTEEAVATAAAQLSLLPDEELKPLILMAIAQAPSLGVQIPEGMTEEMIVQMILSSPDTKAQFIQVIAAASVSQQVSAEAFAGTTAAQVAATLTDAQYATLYELDGVPREFSDSSYENNLFLLGDVKESSPASIYLFASTFENKDMIAEKIGEYNDSVNDLKKIEYTDYVGILMSSITTVLNAITYVLIAFVAISLVVSSIMIGIITYISVLERTKEIGILRAIGASKRDIRRVFNAETLIVGFTAGAIGILVTLGLNVIINIILLNLTGLVNLKAVLPVEWMFILVGVSVIITVLAGLFPSRFAAKRNPVEALRSE